MRNCARTYRIFEFIGRDRLPFARITLELWTCDSQISWSGGFLCSRDRIWNVFYRCPMSCGDGRWKNRTLTQNCNILDVLRDKIGFGGFVRTRQLIFAENLSEELFRWHLVVMLNEIERSLLLKLPIKVSYIRVVTATNIFTYYCCVWRYCFDKPARP